jgi:alpha-galactosidase
MALVYFRGGEERGVNVWRRWYKAHVLPRCRGNPIKPSVSFSDNNNGVEFLSATEENQIRGLEWFKKNIKVKGEGFWWIDAGWYIAKNNKGEPEWPVTGTWKPDPERFSRGLSPVGKAAKEAGLNFLVWFEPERVRPGTQLAEDHPEWLLKLKETKAPENMLLNLANPECLAWICETILKLIRDSGIRWYRQDFNFEPLRYWRDNEAPDRQGMLENLYVQGYLKFWDYLLTSEPGLAIDSCASGGRRNDLETMRRSVPLHPTDYGYGYHHINQSFRHTLYEWIPYTRSWFGSWDKNNEYYDHTNYYQADEPSFDNFIMVNSFGVFLGGFSTAAIESCGAEAAAYVNKMLDVFTDFSEIALNGDFYALTENHRDFTKWTVFQFNWPEKNKGVIQALRNNKSPEASIKVQLRGIDNERRYRFINKETGEAFEIDGNRIFAEGLTFTQPVRSGAIWLYFGI